MLTKELIQRVEAQYNRGAQSTNSRFSERLAYNIMISTRNYLIVLKRNKRRSISYGTYQTISCIEVIRVRNEKCPCIPIKGCFVFRSRYEIPEIIDTTYGLLLDNISTLGGEGYTLVTEDRYNWILGSKYGKNANIAIFKNNYLYFYTPRKAINGTLKLPPKVIKISAVFIDPDKTYSFMNYCKDNTNPQCFKPIEDREFLIDAELISPLIEMTASEAVNQFSISPQDLTNNSIDDINTHIPNINQEKQNEEKRKG